MLEKPLWLSEQVLKMNRSWGFYTCCLLCLDIKSLWMMETLIPEVSGASCSTLHFGADSADGLLVLPQHCWDLWKKYFISLEEWLWSLLGCRWTERNLFFCKASLWLFPSATAVPCLFFLPPAGASVIPSISANTGLYPVSSCPIAEGKGDEYCSSAQLDLWAPLLYPFPGWKGQCRVSE